MPDALELLAEAHVRGWQRRVRHRPPSASESWEPQLFRQIVGYRLAAKDEAERAAQLRRRANDLQITLLAAVERDRPRMALALARQLASYR